MKIDAILIVCLILQLYTYGTAMPIEIPRIYGSKLVDKSKYSLFRDFGVWESCPYTDGRDSSCTL
jgi:hypothetical protein